MESERVVEERTSWVRRYALAIQTVGILVILSSVGYGVWLTLDSWHGGTLSTPQKLLFVSTGLQVLNAVAYGVAALALAQLLRYVFGETRERGLLLRFADKGLIIWAGLGLFAHFLTVLAFSQFPHVEWWRVLAVPGVMVPIARVLVLVSLALILRRALPIVEESRSLV